MDQETICRHINQQLRSIMAVDMDVNEYVESALVHTKECLDNSAGKYNVNLGGGKRLPLCSVYDIAVLAFPYHVSKRWQRYKGRKSVLSK